MQHQEEVNAFIFGIPWSMLCIWIYNYISNKVDHEDRSYLGAILLAPLFLSGILAFVSSWIYIYEINSGVDYGRTPLDDWLNIMFPFFSVILSTLSTGGLIWGCVKFYKKYK
ncbi:MAG: hypothetical protein HRT95_11220 [Moritella sp.]|nr:hypothetical protein [Moritella sp.]